jgi:hypothetical protein
MHWLTRLLGTVRGYLRPPKSPAESGASGQPAAPPRQSWSQDGQTVRLVRSRSSRIAWPARDRARTEDRQDRTAAISRDEEITRLVDLDAGVAADVATPRHDTRTPAPRPEPARDADATRMVGKDVPCPDPVVGWLVVTTGPGRGRALQIAPGANTIGRGANQNVCLNFGDEQISRERHAVVIYDPPARKFYLQSGDARGLTYLEDKIVLAPVELEDRSTITIGETRLRFVAFCGPEFDW